MTLALSSDLSSHVAELRAEVDRALTERVEFAEGCPDRLAEAAQYSLLSPGKRLRPLLVLLAAEACGLERGQAMPAACAVEMIHAYSLIHDDLPAMDDDDLRRGRPTCHRAFGEDVAILAGDALLTRAFEVLASEVLPASAAAKCCQALAVAAGASGMVGGQVDDLDGEQLPTNQQELESIHLRKTAALIQVSVQLGGIVAEAKPEQIEALRRYGNRLGLAFQVVDDLLDASGDEEKTGKRVQKDSDRGKITCPGLMGMEASTRRAEQLVEEARASLQIFGKSATHLDSLARFVVERDH